MVRKFSLIEVENYPLFGLVQTLVEVPGDVRRQILDGLDNLYQPQ